MEGGGSGVVDAPSLASASKWSLTQPIWFGNEGIGRKREREGREEGREGEREGGREGRNM